MEEYEITISKIDKITHDVFQLTTEKPADYNFTPGQATEVSIDKDGWEKEKRPFTFTSLPTDAYLEFIIKSYPNHNGVTEQIAKLKAGDHLLIGEAWGAITYQRPGTFIAGGAGITPFISIFRDLEKKDAVSGNRLIFSNKTKGDIILPNYWEQLLDENYHPVLTEKESGKRVDKDFLKKLDLKEDEQIYLCGPPAMVEDLTEACKALGLDTNNVVLEE
jgi:ferredoxin-NADP reductase